MPRSDRTVSDFRMKIIIFLSLSLAVLCLVQAQPLPEEPIEPTTAETLVELAEEPQHVQLVDVLSAHSRQKRATCDLLSKWDVKHTACAGHCLAKGFKGGYCNDKAVCVCRR